MKKEAFENKISMLALRGVKYYLTTFYLILIVSPVDMLF